MIFQEASTEMDVKTFNVILTDNNFPWAVLLSTLEITSNIAT